MRRRSKVLLAVSVLAVLLAIGALAFLHGGRPRRDGEHPLPGLSAEVEVRWDRWAVPHVAAASAADVVAALGWLHANDRFTQMELGRRAAAGRLSEVLGEATVGVDEHFRTLRLAATAEAMWQAAPESSRDLLLAYARGVDAWLALGRLPPELRALVLSPEPWSPRDSLGIALMMAVDLAFWNDRPEEERFRWLGAFGVDGVHDLIGGPPLEVEPAILAMAATAAPQAGDDEEPARGSNNWAVAGSRTAAGRPIVANDPHLGFHLPAVWYQALLRSPGYEAAGMTLPGTPGVVLGRGPHVAWAFTNVMLDDHDLFFEELRRRPDGREEVRRGDGWAAVESEEATIVVRGAGVRRITLRRTDRGPLLDPGDGLPPRSLAWTAYAGGDPVGALAGLAGAVSADDARSRIAPYVGPAQNLVASFADGSLLFTVLGRVPARRAGDGRLPSPGWDPAYGWDGLRPRDTNPTVVDPPAGVLVTANADHRPPGYVLPLVADFFGPQRAERIRRRLVAESGWTPERIAALQTDAVDLYADDVLQAIGPELAGLDGEAARAASALQGWDRAMTSPGPAALWGLFDRELRRRVFEDEGEESGLAPIGDRDALLRVLRGETVLDWVDDVRTPEVESRREQVAASLVAALRAGEGRWGSDVASWRWDELHALTLRHRLDRLPLLGPWLRRGPWGLPGSATTVLALGGRWRGDRFEVTYGPSMRWIAEPGREGRSFAVLPGGQSGHGADPAYDDQLPLYLAGELHPAPWREDEIAAATVSRLRLRP